jgi:hypothetical protein
VKQEFAETVGLQALGWLVGHDELLPVFLGATGVGLDELKARAGEPDLLISVLDFLCMDDAWVAEFCAAAELPPEAPLQARQALPGGAAVHWT